ncbi:hypothetical protein [Ekhidna sp.]|uniref:hypothetical protein n=1 Tax=Ekhidna sp. TaxID=2608089 RepID=UPI003B5BF440
MKKLIIIALACSLSWTLSATEINEGETRSAKVTVNISKSDRINIQAKYTELIVEAWDKPQVEIEAIVRYDGKMTDKIQEFLDDFEQNVKDHIQKGATELLIDTDLDIPNKIQIGGKHVGIQISYGDDELKVTYKVKAPGVNDYEISNSYEDVRMIGSFKKVDFKQYSGELEAEMIEEGIFNMKYGSASIQQIGNAKMEIYEQELDARIIGTLELNAKYSNMELAEVETIEATSYESDYQIGSIDEISGNFKYGEIEITERLGEGKLEFYEMDMEIEDVELLVLTSSKYSKFEIEKAKSITFEQSYEDETNIGTLGQFKSMNSKYGNHRIETLESSFQLNAYEDEVEIKSLSPEASDVYIDGKYIDASIGISNASFILKSNVKYGKVEYDESSVDVKRYIKDGDQLEVEAHSKNKRDKSVNITVNGYEVDVKLN